MAHDDDKTSLSFSRWQIIAILLAAFVCGCGLAYALQPITGGMGWAVAAAVSVLTAIGIIVGLVTLLTPLEAPLCSCRDKLRLIDSLRDDLNVTSSRVHGLQCDIRARDEQLADLRAQLAAAQSQPRPDAMAQINGERSAYYEGYVQAENTMRAAMDAAEDEKAQVKQRMADAFATIDKLNNRIRFETDARKTADRRVADLEAQIEVAAIEISKLKKDVRKATRVNKPKSEAGQ